MATHTARSIQLHLEYTLSLKVGVRIMAAEALRMLAHVSTLRARLWRWDQSGEHTLVATNGSLQLANKKQEKSIKSSSVKAKTVYKKLRLKKAKTRKCLIYLHSIPQAWGVVSGVAHRRHSHSLRTNNQLSVT